MNNNVYSVNQKKQLNLQTQTNIANSINVRGLETHTLSDYYTQDTVPYLIESIKDQPYLPINFRIAAKNSYNKMFDCFKDGIAIHNQYLVGTTFPLDSYEWHNIVEFMDFKVKASRIFAEFGREIAHRKRRLKAFNALFYFYQNVLVPIDNFVFAKDNTRLSVLFEMAIDQLAQSYISAFLHTDSNNAIKNDSYSTIEQFNVIQGQIECYNVLPYIESEYVCNLALNSTSTLTECSPDQVSGYLFDIYELLPLYAKSWNPEKHAFRANGMVMYIYLDNGLPFFSFGDESSSVTVLFSASTKFYWTINGDFVYFANQQLNDCVTNLIGRRLLALLHDKLVSLFAMRDANKSKHVPVEHSEPSELISFTNNYHYILSAQEVVKTDSPSEDLNLTSCIIPSMRMSQSFSFMIDTFLCHVEQGKGSEMKIWRKGSHIYTIGRHKKDQKIPSTLIIRILKRLNIAPSIWLAELNG
ncbi:MAG: hypothetical protein HAW67_00820 [Endozoicomonadaceae bacterium]|nr:hypothetical protein [Endozoicomonadaceae bacterium]